MTAEKLDRRSSLAVHETRPGREGIVRLVVPETAPPAARYQGTSVRTRLTGIGGVALVGGIILTAAMFSWQSYVVPKAPAELSVFDVAPPAAPPEPVLETPVEPEEVPQEQQQPIVEKPVMEPPKVEVPSLNQLNVKVAVPTPDPGPLVKVKAALESKPAPPAPQVSSGKPTWEGLVLGALNKVKRYPRDAQFARQQGVPYIRFVMNREGKVMSVRIERSSGFRSLDQEALALPKRAQPLPKPPADVPGETIELVVPVEFFMR